jgi:hypothetical protein
MTIVAFVLSFASLLGIGVLNVMFGISYFVNRIGFSLPEYLVVGISLAAFSLVMAIIAVFSNSPYVRKLAQMTIIVQLSYIALAILALFLLC